MRSGGGSDKGKHLVKVVVEAVFEAHKPYKVVVFGAVAGHGEKISYAECEHLSNR